MRLLFSGLHSIDLIQGIVFYSFGIEEFVDVAVCEFVIYSRFNTVIEK